jgi:probable HAF family extracellular repeat protein
MNALTFKRVSFAVVALSAIVARDAWGQVQYTITDLGNLSGGTYSAAAGINNLGQVVGYTWNGVSDHAFLYSGGSMQDLGTLPGGTGAVAVGINNAGQIVGYSYNSSSTGNLNAFIYSTGSMQNIGPLNPEAINNLGQVVGETWTDVAHACLYGSGVTQDLGTLGGAVGIAQGINDNGLIVGEAYPSGSSTFNAFLYSGGSMQDLGTFGGTFSEASAINQSGQIVGSATYSNGMEHAFLDTSGLMQDLGTLGGTFSEGGAINDEGWIVGSAYNSTMTSGAGHAFIYKLGSMQDLNNLIPPKSGWILEYGTGINDNGQICGYGEYGGQTQAFLLTPVPTPEPSTLALFGATALGLLAYAWRRRRAT